MLLLYVLILYVVLRMNVNMWRSINFPELSQ